MQALSVVEYLDVFEERGLGFFACLEMHPMWGSGDNRGECFKLGGSVLVVSSRIVTGDDDLNWSVCLMGNDGSDSLQRVDLLSLGSIEPPVGLDDIGIGREQGRALLAALQAAVVSLQEAALRSSAQKRVATSPNVKMKDYRARKVQTLFGTVSFRIPRLIDHGQIEAVLPISSNARSTREFDELRTRLSAWMSFRSAMNLLADMYPVDSGVSPSTALRQIAKAAETMESCFCHSSTGDASTSLPMDTTFIRARETDESRSLEILVGAIGQGIEPVQYFASPLKMKDECIRLGKAALATCNADKIEAFSDSDRSVRAMVKAFGVAEKPISDWFHLSMRIQHTISIADALEAPTRSIARANKAVQASLRKMRTELWKGDTKAVARAQRMIMPHLKQHPDEPKSAARQKRVKKLRAALKKLAKYVTNPEARIVDYCSRKIEGHRLGTSLVEGVADFVVNARMAKSQHMRWTKQGAYNILQVRTANINLRLREEKLAA